MNDFINHQLNRYSVRSFDSDRKIPRDVLETLLKAANQAPTSAGGQQYSIIIVDDAQRKEKLYEWTMSRSGKGMSYIKKAPIFLLFVMDFHKIDLALEFENQSMNIGNCVESLLVGSIDVGILAEAFSAAAESIGLGTVIVGGIRKSTQEIIDLFQLPKYTFPLIGMAVGYPDDKAKKGITPRLPLEALYHYNVYNDKPFINAFKDYNVLMQKHYSSRGVEDLTWTKLMSNYYAKEMYQDLKDTFQRQGFHLN